MALVTAENVYAAADTILARGERPTTSRIRAELGGGSPNDILPLLNTWKDAQRQRPTPEPEPKPEPETEIAVPEMLPEIGQAMDGLSSLILTTINTLIDRERAKAATAQQAIQAAADRKVELARQEADQRVNDALTDAAAQIEDARSEAQDLARQVAELEDERGALQQQQAATDAALQGSQAEGARMAEELATDRATIAGQAETIKALTADLTHSQDTIATQAARIEELEEERRQLIAQAAEERKAAEGREAALRGQIDAAETDRRRQAEEHAKERAAAQEREEGLRQDLRETQDRERAAQAVAAKLDKDNTALETRLAAAAGDLDKVTADRDQAEGRARQAEQAAAELRGELAAIRAEGAAGEGGKGRKGKPTEG